MRFSFFSPGSSSLALKCCYIYYPSLSSYTERQDDPSSSEMQWKITDVAGPSQLGRKERLQYKKNLLGELEGHTFCYVFISEVVLIYTTLEYNANS